MFTSIDKIAAQIQIRPLSYAMLNDLVSSGDLDAAVVGRLQTLPIFGTQRAWDKATKGTGPALNTNCSPH
jgi:hypothetical protein